MNIIENIVSQGHGSLQPSYFVIHETANPGATALNHVNYWKNTPIYAVHYVGDWTGNVYHTVPDNRLCWQVGNGNPFVLGIELCHATNAADFKKVWDLGIEFSAYILKKKGWGIDRLISHDEARLKWGGTDHTDPVGYFKKFGKSWPEFKAEVQRRLSAPTSTPTTQKPEEQKPSGEIHRVQTGAFRLQANAKKLQSELQKRGFDTMIVKVGGLYKVQVGAYSVKANAENMKKKLDALGYPTMMVSSGAAKKATAEEVARSIINDRDFGGWGTGATREQRLRDAGYDPAEVQRLINALLK